MDTIQLAKKILRDAEESVNKLIEKALADQRYDDIKGLADIADGVSRLIRGEKPQPAAPVTPASRAGYGASQSPRRPPRPKKPTKKAGASKNSQYPWFGRDGNRLVKVGWSKKNKKEYEHRVAREVVANFAKLLADRVAEGELFDVDGLLPVPDQSGEEIPAYQVYLTIAWLRDIGVLEKKGRDGYVMRDPSIAGPEFSEFWNAVPSREAKPKETDDE